MSILAKKSESSNLVNEEKNDFRDPKVFYNLIKKGFSLVVAAGEEVEFYFSKNLKDWEKTGEFKVGVNGFGGICECPDCFPLETEEGTHNKHDNSK